MNLIERYLHAVKRELPPSTREETVRELRGLLHDHLEEQSHQRGRTLNDGDVAAFLQNYGHPTQVAAGYWTRRTLVDESVYPLYKQVLPLVLAVYLAVQVLLVLLEPSNGLGLEVFFKLAYDMMATLLFAAVGVTVLFHYFGSEIAQLRWLKQWSPQRLPALSAPWGGISRFESTVSLLFLAPFALVLLNPPLIQLDNWQMQASQAAVPWLRALGWVALLEIGLSLLNLFQPYWTRSKLLLQSALNALAVVALLALVALPETLSSSGISTTPWTVWGVRIGLLTTAAVIAWNMVVQLRRSLSREVPGI